MQRTATLQVFRHVLNVKASNAILKPIRFCSMLSLNDADTSVTQILYQLGSPLWVDGTVILQFKVQPFTCMHAGSKAGGLKGGPESPSSAAAQGDAGDDRGGNPSKDTGAASGKKSNQDESTTSTVGGSQKQSGTVGSGASSTIGRD